MHSFVVLEKHRLASTTRTVVERTSTDVVMLKEISHGEKGSGTSTQDVGGVTTPCDMMDERARSSRGWMLARWRVGGRALCCDSECVMSAG